MLNSRELGILTELKSTAPLDLYREHIAANDARIWEPELGNGRDIAAERTAVHTALVAHWAEKQHLASGYDRPFAVVALGGTGRNEMTPCSDTDFGFIVDDDLDDNEFIDSLQLQLGLRGDFTDTYGFECGALPFNLEVISGLENRQFNSFIDMRPVYDPTGFTEQFRETLRTSYDPFKHFLFIHNGWRQRRKDGRHQSEKLDSFDIKMDGLRVFLAGIWAMAGDDFRTSHEIYKQLGDSPDVDAYYFLLRIRAFVQSRRGTKSAALGGGAHNEDTLNFDDFTSFGEMLGKEASDKYKFEFANKVRARLLNARRRVARFTRGIMGQELSLGRRIHPRSTIFYGPAGLRQSDVGPNASTRVRSSAALSLLLAAQRYELPIDPAELDRTFQEAGEWLTQTPEVSDLFFEEHGSLATSFEFLSQFAGAENRIFPGYAEFEVSIDERVMNEQEALRGALVHRKIRLLEEWRREGTQMLDQQLQVGEGSLNSAGAAGRVPLETAMLDDESFAAVKLALKTKRLPLTKDDMVVRKKESLALYDRFASGFSEIPIDDFYSGALAGCGFPKETLEITEFLIANRRQFKVAAEQGPNDSETVREMIEVCGDQARLRALYIFHYADRFEWESEGKVPQLWFSVRELYGKLMARFMPKIDPDQYLSSQGFDPEQVAVLRSFGNSLLGGGYGDIGIQLGYQLSQLALEPEGSKPKAKIVRRGGSTILAVAARDSRGLAACISGALYDKDVQVLQAHLFSSREYEVGLDFFHLFINADHPMPDGLVKTIENAIAAREHLEDHAMVPRLGRQLTMAPWRSSGYRLTANTDAENATALIYALTYQVYKLLGGNVHGVQAQARKSQTKVTVFHSLPENLSFEDAQFAIIQHFAETSEEI